MGEVRRHTSFVELFDGRLPYYYEGGEIRQMGRKVRKEEQRFVLDNLPRILGELPVCRTQDLKPKNFSQFKPGQPYILDQRITAENLRILIDFGKKQPVREVQLLLLCGKWVFILGEGRSVALPPILFAISDLRCFQLDIHSHPCDKKNKEEQDRTSRPSFEDLNFLRSSIDGRKYIIHDSGLLEVEFPTTLPGIEGVVPRDISQDGLQDLLFDASNNLIRQIAARNNCSSGNEYFRDDKDGKKRQGE